MEVPLAAAARVCESGRERELDLLEIGKETETEFVMRFRETAAVIIIIFLLQFSDCVLIARSSETLTVSASQ